MENTLTYDPNGNRLSQLLDGSSRSVRVAPFAIDRTETTVAAYMRCINDGGCRPRWNGFSAECNLLALTRFDHPMNCVGLPLGGQAPPDRRRVAARRQRQRGACLSLGRAATTVRRVVCQAPQHLRRGA